MKNLQFLIPILFCITLSCRTAQVATSKYGAKDGKVEWIFLQTNDVYEIVALSGGKKGGMARVATLKKELLKENPSASTRSKTTVMASLKSLNYPLITMRW